MFHRFLSTAEAKRALKGLQRLSHHDISAWVLVGGLAIEIHWLRVGQPPSVRKLNDIDFIAPAFDCLPETLADDFLFRYVHPLEPPGKLTLQLVDAETALRIDVFSAYGASLTRALAVDFPSRPIRLLSCEDVLARAARLLLDLRANVPVSVKQAQDYVRLKKVADLAATEIAWQDHRKPDYPTTFKETNSLVEDLMKNRGELLAIPEYSKDVSQGLFTMRFQLRLPAGRPAADTLVARVLLATWDVYRDRVSGPILGCATKNGPATVNLSPQRSEHRKIADNITLELGIHRQQPFAAHYSG